MLSTKKRQHDTDDMKRNTSTEHEQCAAQYENETVHDPYNEQGNGYIKKDIQPKHEIIYNQNHESYKHEQLLTSPNEQLSKNTDTHNYEMIDEPIHETKYEHSTKNEILKTANMKCDGQANEHLQEREYLQTQHMTYLKEDLPIEHDTNQECIERSTSLPKQYEDGMKMSTYEESIQEGEIEQCEKDVNTEMNALHRMRTWTLCDLHTNMNTVQMSWKYRKK